MSENQTPEEQVEQIPAYQKAGYANEEAWLQATYASRAEGSRLAQELNMLKSQLEEVRQLPSQRARERESAWEQLEQIGVPQNLLRDAVREAASEMVNGTIGPMIEAQKAIASVRASNPDFSKHEQNLQNWLAENPALQEKYSRAVAQSPEAAELALEGIFSKFAREKGFARKQVEPTPTQVESAAQLPSGKQAGARAPKPEGPTQEEFNKAIEYANKTGDKLPLMKMAFGNLLDKHTNVYRK